MIIELIGGPKDGQTFKVSGIFLAMLRASGKIMFPNITIDTNLTAHSENAIYEIQDNKAYYRGFN